MCLKGGWFHIVPLQAEGSTSSRASRGSWLATKSKPATARRTGHEQQGQPECEQNDAGQTGSAWRGLNTKTNVRGWEGKGFILQQLREGRKFVYRSGAMVRSSSS